LQSEPWYLADLCNTAIGQGLVSATPVQMATGFSAIVNGGTVYKPHLVGQKENISGEKIKVKAEKIDEVEVDQKYFDNILEGMSQAVDYGTATGLKGLPGNPKAKTGSSEATVRTQSGRIIEGAHSWVLGTFEYEGKDYVFVVAQQFGGRGYKSVPVAADFIDCLYKNFQGCR
jgi:penicillin-binding protein 2